MTYSITILIMFSFGYEIYSQYKKKNLDFPWQIIKRFKIIMLFEVIGIIIITVTIGISLYSLSPVFQFSWTTLFFNESINIIFVPLKQTTQITNPLTKKLLITLIILILLYVMPFFVKVEEKIFRKGHTNWLKIIKMSLFFGLIHMIVGIPLAFGLALSFTGFFFACKYRKKHQTILNSFEKLDLTRIKVVNLSNEEAKLFLKKIHVENQAITTSTTYHTLYNYIFLIILYVSLMF